MKYVIERRGTIVTYRDTMLGGEARMELGYATNMTILIEVKEEWPEIYEIIRKISSGIKLSKSDELWFDELVAVSGWDRDDIIDDLMGFSVDPSKRAEKYLNIFRKYYSEAKNFVKRNNTVQAGEKIWGAVLALIKFYAAIKNVPILEWSRGRIENFITNNVPRNKRKMFRDLIDKAHPLHVHFYEKNLDDKSFQERWESVIEMIKKAKKIIKKKLI